MDSKKIEKAVQSHLEKLQERMPPISTIPQMPTMLRDYAKLLNKTASEATAKALKSANIPALSRSQMPDEPLKIEQHLAALHAANLRAQAASWTMCQHAFEAPHLRMDSVNESLTFSIENIQEAIHVTKNVHRHFRDLGNTLTDDTCFYRVVESKDVDGAS
ncbi:hypothetical protein H310_09007 [Aphanomyces invadans]|uniref:Uncharacterized protein n=1 Tax=Aphanomyces invadans TaxID=157072 RepID=A0A024TXD9_9STRA|nr:hypothetical protein H310_09007 [Aphanomyces invadans]ETV98296.1 hypothetical protein H310_09007 [Aphanomyces invadans]|eukprot:XP_008873171.1 hypothetical protein H310_09007 [Aphanomyces invadans]